MKQSFFTNQLLVWSKTSTLSSDFKFLLSSCWIMFFVIAPKEGYSQDFIEEVSLLNANFSPSQLSTYQALSQDSFTEDICLVSVGSPFDFMDKNGILTIVMPRYFDTIRAEIFEITETDTSQGWIGKIPDTEGSIAIYRIDSMLGAWIQIDTFFYQIMPITGSISSMRRISRTVGQPGECTQATSQVTMADYCEPDYNSCETVIDILILYPPDVTTYLNDRFGTAPQIIPLYLTIGTFHALRLALIRSDIPNKFINTRIEPFNFIYPINLEVPNMLDAVVNQVSSRRIATGSDLAILLTGMDVPGAAGAVQQIAQVGNEPAFGFVEIPFLINPRWTFVHEVGHLLGARHNRGNVAGNDNHLDCGHGWTIDENRFQRTVMAVFEMNDDNRVLNYSNPSVLFNGEVTGDEDSDNARTIRNAACAVGDYMEHVNFYAYARVPQIMCFSNEGNYVITQGIVSLPPFGSGGAGPYTYDWRWNTTGDFGNDPGTQFGTTVNATLLVPNEYQIWVRLIVTASDNSRRYSTVRVRIVPCDIHPFQITAGPITNADDAEFRIYPNPSTGDFRIQIDQAENTAASINIYNFFGELVYSIPNQELVKGKNIFSIDLSELPSGMYSCSLFSLSNASKSLIFTIVR